jgi:hypothetical protein
VQLLPAATVEALRDPESVEEPQVDVVHRCSLSAGERVRLSVPREQRRACRVAGQSETDRPLDTLAGLPFCTHSADSGVSGRFVIGPHPTTEVEVLLATHGYFMKRRKAA